MHGVVRHLFLAVLACGDLALQFGVDALQFFAALGVRGEIFVRAFQRARGLLALQLRRGAAGDDEERGADERRIGHRTAAHHADPAERGALGIDQRDGGVAFDRLFGQAEVERIARGDAGGNPAEVFVNDVAAGRAVEDIFNVGDVGVVDEAGHGARAERFLAGDFGGERELGVERARELLHERGEVLGAGAAERKAFEHFANRLMQTDPLFGFAHPRRVVVHRYWFLHNAP